MKTYDGTLTYTLSGKAARHIKTLLVREYTTTSILSPKHKAAEEALLEMNVDVENLL